MPSHHGWKALMLSRRWDSNPRPMLYESIALPAELLRLTAVNHTKFTQLIDYFK